ncbi:MAG: NAD(+)/NADH kinase [Clostridiales bacterium]|jgi:NAD+ kinase|nr:NAD(+)/NADH kinase [Clostridiales bacterium]
MKIGIYSNTQRDNELKAAKKFVRELSSAGIDYFVAESGELNGGRLLSREEVLNLCDIIVVFGGDGTILGIVKNASAKSIPVLGVNMGNLGFLTETDESGLGDIVKALKNRAYTIEERAMLEANADGETYTALNEIVIRESAAKIAHIRLYVDDSMVDEYYADGVLISTPTGSTAYSLSAGGPILAPDVDALIINPLNPHSLHSRPFVVSGKSAIRLESFKNDNLQLVYDGVVRSGVLTKNCVTIAKSKTKASFVRIKPYDFYNKILYKFNKDR